MTREFGTGISPARSSGSFRSTLQRSGVIERHDTDGSQTAHVEPAMECETPQLGCAHTGGGWRAWIRARPSNDSQRVTRAGWKRSPVAEVAGGVRNGILDAAHELPQNGTTCLIASPWRAARSGARSYLVLALGSPPALRRTQTVSGVSARRSAV